MRQSINRLLAVFGYSLVKQGFIDRVHRVTMDGILASLARKGYSFGTIVDIGASDGRWSGMALKHFPNASCLLIEAQEVHRSALASFQQKHGNARIVLAAAGERAGQVYFDVSDPFGGQAADTPSAAHSRGVPATTLDAELAGGSPIPYLVKFDTHGFEAPILRGSAKTLEKTSVIIMESYNFRISSECMLFYEMCKHMLDLGFRCIDMADPMHRPFDDNLWQMDLVFARDDRPEFRHLQYK